MSKRLTICVPTYNRASELIGCLNSIGAALAELTEEQQDQVAVIVSDNASTDETEAVMKARYAELPWLHYHRNAENIGGEGNFYRLTQMSQSEYIWVLGDDDRLKLSAIRVILSRLTQNFDLLICNCSVQAQGFAGEKKQCHFSLAADREFFHPGDVMERFGAELGYISVQVFRRARFSAVSVAEYQKFAEYGHSFMYGIYVSLLPQSRTLYIAEPLVISQQGTSSFDWYKFFAVGTSLVFDALQARGYSLQSVLAGKHQALRDSVLPHTLVCRRDGREISRGLFWVLLPHYRRNWLFWISLPGLLLPGTVLRLLDTLVFSSRRRRSVA